MEIHADHDDQDNRQNADEGGDAHGHVPAVNGEAEYNGDYNEQQRYHSHTRICSRSCYIDCAAFIKGSCEGACHDGSECSDYQDQGQVGKNNKQPFRALAHVCGDDFSDGFSAVAKGGEQGAEVMDSSEENTSDQYPEGNRQPAKSKGGGVDRTGDGTGSGDGREMVPHQYRCFRRHIVHSVLHGMSGCGDILFTDSPFFA